VNTYTPLGYILSQGEVFEGGVAVIDLVCGMEVHSENAAAAWEHAGTTYLFCSVGCMERFRADPERFLAAGPKERGM
jgi:YHS domain-containing protein